MSLSARVWTAPLIDAPAGEPAQRFEALRRRRIELAHQVRERSLADQAASRELERAERAARDTGAEVAAMGGPADGARAARKELDGAVKAAARAAERYRDAVDALGFVEGAASELVQLHGPELLDELDAPAAAACDDAHAALARAAAAVDAWKEIARRQETLLTGSGLLSLRTPHDALGELAGELQRLAARIPAATIERRAI